MKPPAILRPHGGPASQFANEFEFEMQVFAANGYAVIMPNPRGSTGRGEEFALGIFAAGAALAFRDFVHRPDSWWVVPLIGGLIVGFGGGSAMDLAKLVAVLTVGRQTVHEVVGPDKVTGPRIPLAGGMALTAISMYGMSTLDTGTSGGVMSLWFAGLGLGQEGADRAPPRPCRRSSAPNAPFDSHCLPTSMHGPPARRPTAVRARCRGPDIQTPH